MGRMTSCALACAALMTSAPRAFAQEAPEPARLPPPASTAPMPTTTLTPTVSFVASPGVAFHRLPSPGAKPTRICLAPCAASIFGQQRFSLSYQGGEPIEAQELLPLSPGSRVEGEYRDNSGWRQTGWIVLGVGVSGGITVIASGLALLSSGSTSDERTGGIMAAGGGVATLVSLVAGLALIFDGDEVHVRLPNPTP